VCPTEALLDKKEYTLSQKGKWDEERMTGSNTIGYELHVMDNQIVKMTSPADNPITPGMLYQKGRYGQDYVQADDDLQQR
jgi:hypothetical protein